jgi:hypothetical protein
MRLLPDLFAPIWTLRICREKLEQVIIAATPLGRIGQTKHITEVLVALAGPLR